MSPTTRETSGFANARLESLDLLVVCFVDIGGLIFLWNAPAWAPDFYIGHDQFGDADFWWQGVLEMSQGIFWDNINFTYRMGYATFGGLFVTLFGANYAFFHKFLVAIFLATASALYIIGVPRVGRTMALALMATVVFSPLLAEHLATSTSDGLGLIFNLVALIALWRALTGRTRYGALATAGIFIALAALTRPLMTIFAAPAALLIFLFAKGSVRSRAVPVIVFVVAVALPTLPWSALFYLKTGNLGLAGYDASIFYAASDPNVQVWDPPMYLPIEQAAKERLGVASVTARQLDDEFRRQAAANYVKYFGYHLRRLPGHILALAGFSYETLNPTNPWGILTRLLIRGLLMLGLLVSCWVERRWFGAAAALAIFGLAFWPTAATLIVIATALLFVLPFRWRGTGPIERLTALYWWSGVAALFLTGGTWGPPLAPHIDINALGYRLGSQFLFANDWLILMALTAAAGRPRVTEAWLARWVDRNAWLTRIDGARVVRLAVGLGLAVLTVLYVAGLSVFGARAWQRSHTIPIHMPPVAPLVSALCADAGGLLPKPIEAQPASVLLGMWHGENPAKRLEGLRLFTGAVGGLIWQMAGQDRTRALFYQQDISSPFEFNNFRTDVEFDGLLPESLWRYRAGAWLVRSFREAGPYVDYEYYQTLPKVQMFVPLAADRQSFDFASAVRFRLARYSSILSFSGDLHPANAVLGWQKYPSADTKRRWFTLEPAAPAGNSGDITIDIDVGDAIGSRMVSFSFGVEPVPGNPLRQDQISVAVQSINAAGQTRDLVRRTSPHGGAVDGPIDDVSATISDDASRVRISFHGVSAEEMVRVIELKIVSDDVRPGIISSLCAPP